MSRLLKFSLLTCSTRVSSCQLFCVIALYLIVQPVAFNKYSFLYRILHFLKLKLKQTQTQFIKKWQPEGWINKYTCTNYNTKEKKDVAGRRRAHLRKWIEVLFVIVLAHQLLKKFNIDGQVSGVVDVLGRRRRDVLCVADIYHAVGTLVASRNVADHRSFVHVVRYTSTE